MSLGMHFCISWQFNATELVIKDYSINVYLSGPIIGMSGVASMVFSIFITEFVPRKNGIIGLNIAAAIIGLALFAWLPCRGDKCSQ